MMRRISAVEAAAGAAILFGLLAAFTPWYSYDTSSAHISVNGFRASLLGDLFFLSIAAGALLLLARLRLVELPAVRRVRPEDGFMWVASVAAVLLVLQLFLNLISGGRSLGAGALFAFLAVIALAVTAWLAQSRRAQRRAIHETFADDL